MVITSVLYNEYFLRRYVTKKGNAAQVELIIIDVELLNFSCANKSELSVTTYPPKRIHFRIPFLKNAPYLSEYSLPHTTEYYQ